MRFEREVQAWLDGTALAELGQAGFAQVDVDELLDPAPARAASAMLECLAVARALVTDAAIAGVVVIPLPVVDDQAAPPTDHRALTEVVGLDWDYGPGHAVPGLYLLRDDTRLPNEEVEEYRLAVPGRAPARGVTRSRSALRWC